MGRYKFRSHKFRLIIFISFVWFAFVLFSFRFNIGESDHENKAPIASQLQLAATTVQATTSVQQFPVKQLDDYEAVQQNPSNKIEDFEDNVEERIESTFSTKYKNSQLHLWSPAIFKPENTDGPGENGLPVIIPPEDQDLMKAMFEQNQYNLLAGNMISLNRTLRDVRLESCIPKKYPVLLPSTSIVIVFHNEAWTTLLRTIWSAINRSPASLLKEIILVDDASERDYLGEKLEQYIKTFPKPVHLYRTVNRSGLIRARLLGAKHVKGEVITFLDAHCECAEGWLEPLLARIAENRKTVVCPEIDTISDETFEYYPTSGLNWGGFNWKLNFRWYQIPPREMARRKYDGTAPIRSPTMAGGLLSIDREYFYEIGSYDEGMEVWGGENLEMSFRIWQCGGTLEIIPCSHVGHVFRNKSPYTFPGGPNAVIRHNLWRVASVWMDDWKYFYFIYSLNNKNLPQTDISARTELRNRLECKSFEWYLEHIYPEAEVPYKYHYLGDIKNAQNNKCLDTMNKKDDSELGMFTCHNTGGNQLFVYTDYQQIMSNDNCLAVHNTKLIMVRCTVQSLNQKWEYNDKFKTFKQSSSRKCLGSSEKFRGPVLVPCVPNEVSQQWILNNPFKWQAPNHLKSSKSVTANNDPSDELWPNVDDAALFADAVA